MLFCKRNLEHVEEKIAFASTCTRPDTSFDNAQLSQVISTSVESKKRRYYQQDNEKAQWSRPYCVPSSRSPLNLHNGICRCCFCEKTPITPSSWDTLYFSRTKNDHAAIIHYGSWKCQRVTRSVLGAEVHAFSHCLLFCASFIPRSFSNTPAESVHRHIYGL